MVYYINLVIVLLCLLMFFVYRKTKSYISLNGFLMVLILGTVMVLKFRVTKDLQTVGFRTDNIMDTLVPLLVFNSICTVIMLAMRFRKKKFQIFSWAASLLVLYLIFGLAQQVFFQAIFTHTLSQIINDRNLVITFSTLFYSSFHWSWEVSQIRLGFLTLIAGAVWSTVFLGSPNIYLLGVSHAFLASIYYYLVNPGNILEKRLSLNGAKGLFKHIYH